MTAREFFTGRAIGFGLLLIVVIGIWGYKTYVSKDSYVEPTTVSIQENTGLPVFTWKFEKADSFNLDGMPETDIFLEATYSNGIVRKELIDTTPGGCNALPDPDRDSVSGTETIQCYSAGLGQRFKIIKGKESYLVQRKTFEEALPDYTPPPYQYETVAEFPLY